MQPPSPRTFALAAASRECGTKDAVVSDHTPAKKGRYGNEENHGNEEEHCKIAKSLMPIAKEWHAHSALMKTLNEQGNVSEPRSIEGALHAVLEKLSAQVDGAFAWRDICRVLHTKSLRPQLFGSLDDAQLDALEETIDYYLMPKDWSVWVRQERAARHVSPPALSVLLEGSEVAGVTSPLAAPLCDAVSRLTKFVSKIKAVTSGELQASLGRVMAASQTTLQTLVDDKDNVFDNNTAVKTDFLLALLVGCCPTVFHSETALFVLTLCGDLEGLKYAHEHGCPWDEETCAAAVRNGHLDCLTYAHEKGCPWDDLTCTWAASRGHLVCLTYAHNHGCPWDKYTCGSAALHGHLDCLTYAREHGCPWTEARLPMTRREVRALAGMPSH